MSADVTIVGNVTRDPELRFTSSGTATASFGVAVNYGKGENQKVSFFDVVCWNEQAENVAESINKGDRVVVTGRLEQRTWETDGGDKRSKVEINAWEVGPSLRWASAHVVRNERRESSDY